MCAGATYGSKAYMFCIYTLHIQESEHLPKAYRSFRFNPQVYVSFKQLAAKKGYTVTAALEKFMSSAVEFGLVFPTAKTENAEAQARVLLAWLKKNKYWVHLDSKEETSTLGLLLELLLKIEDAELRKDIEETLKQKA